MTPASWRPTMPALVRTTVQLGGTGSCSLVCIHLDAQRLRFRLLRNPNVEDSIAITGGDSVRQRILGHLEAAPYRSVGALTQVNLCFLGELRTHPLRFDNQMAIFDA